MHSVSSRSWLRLVVSVASLLAPASVKADATSDFFKGKVVHMVVAYPPGAATTSLPGCWRRFSPGIFPAIRPSLFNTCLALGA